MTSMLLMSMNSNVKLPQNGGRMYPSRDITFHLHLMHSLAYPVKRAIVSLDVQFLEVKFELFIYEFYDVMEVYGILSCYGSL